MVGRSCMMVYDLLWSSCMRQLRAQGFPESLRVAYRYGRRREREIEREGDERERDQIKFLSKSDNNVRGSIMTYTATCY